MTLREHPMALRAPWYTLERQDPKPTRFDPGSLAPTVQKYGSPDFVEHLLRDPRRSLKYEPEDHWSFSAPIAPASATGLRQRLAGRRQVVTPLRKLFLPSHERFYAVTVELFCDIDGLPRPGPRDDVSVEFVVRRVRVETSDNTKAVRRLAVELAKMYAAKNPLAASDDSIVQFRKVSSTAGEDVVGLGSVSSEDLATIETQHPGIVDEAGLHQVVEGWYVDEEGGGRWAQVPLEPGDPVAPGLTEERLPMWRLPPATSGCDRARTRSLWFGLVPTTSSDLDPERNPRYGDRHVYVIQCVATQQPPPGREHCPPLESTSAPSRPYRLAAFFDPAGTAHRQVRVRLPDLEALAAHVAEPGASTGGVQFERPAGSQLPMGVFAQIPKNPDKTPGGATAQFCTFAIELITIVASFVLALFMPVVILVFQLWWMLLLKFCWPPSAQTEALLGALAVNANASLDSLTTDQRKDFAEAAGFPRDVDVVAGLKVTHGDLTAQPGTALELLKSVAPQSQPVPAPPQQDSLPEDPLCQPELPP